MRAIAIGAGSSSPRLRRACARFGLRLTHHSTSAPVHDETLRRLRALRPGGIALLTGRSGCGKSALIGGLRRQLARERGSGRWLTPRDGGSRRVIDAIGGSLDEALATLARVGLADATILPRRVRELSDGERARFGLALVLMASRRRGGRAGDPGWIVIDEFLAVVDRRTARAVAASVRRAWSRGPGERPRLVVATAHGDLADALAPDLLLDLDRDAAGRSPGENGGC